MVREVSVYCEVGPALLLDRSRRPAWRARTFNQVILDETFVDDAARGECCYFKDQDARQCSGEFTFLVDEPVPALVRYAVRKRTGLLLTAPTGALDLVDVCDGLKDAEHPHAPPFLSLDVAPGSYVVDVFGFMPHPDRTENPELQLPEEVQLAASMPDTRWTRPLAWAAALLGLASFGVAIFTVMALFGSGLALTWALMRTPLLVVVGGWIALNVMSRASGEHARDVVRAKAWADYFAGLPKVPDWLVVLRPGTSPAGGGLGSDVVAARPSGE